LSALRDDKVNPPSWTALELLLLACALAAALAVRPWRLLAGPQGTRPLATPLLAAITVLPWLWAWPGVEAVPMQLQWSGAALAVLMLGWPLAVPVLAVAGISTMATAGASWAEALSTTVWLGVLPATAVLLLGQAVRRVFGTNPAVYLLGRAFAVPLLSLFACALAAALASGSFTGVDDEALVVTAFLMAMAETIWTCGVVSILVAWNPQWLATWSDSLYLGARRPAR
jgi:uncharacterized membrane protein